MTLLKYNLYYLLVLSFMNIGVCQKWTTPTKRSEFSINEKSLTVKWNFDAEGNDIIYASFQRADENNNPTFTLAAVNKEGVINVYATDEIESTEVGVITFKKLDKTKDKKILASIEFADSTSLNDDLTIEYVDYAPFFSTALPLEEVIVIEHTQSSKNKEFTVVVKGKPEPIVIWTLNGNPVDGLSGFSVNTTTSMDGLNFEITSKLRIAELLAKHNGPLEVLTKYGTAVQQSPNSKIQMKINVQYAPRNITFTSNVTNNLVINQAYVGLTCEASANPPAVYTITEYLDILYSGTNTTFTTYIDNIYHSNIASFGCEANNSHGFMRSNAIEMSIINGTLAGRKDDDEDSNWWIYYLVGVGIALVVFMGISATIIIIRSRMRSMNIRSVVDRDKSRGAQNKALRHNGRNHTYDLNLRGAPDGRTRTNPPGVNGVANEGYDLSEQTR